MHLDKKTTSEIFNEMVGRLRWETVSELKQEIKQLEVEIEVKTIRPLAAKFLLSVSEKPRNTFESSKSVGSSDEEKGHGEDQF